MGWVASFLQLPNSSVMRLCLAGHFCRENTLKSQNGFPININDRNVGWKGSLEVIQSHLSESGGCPVQPDRKAFALLNHVIYIFSYGSWVSLRMKVAQTLWVPCSSAAVLPSSRVFIFCSHCPLFCHLPLLRDVWQSCFCNTPWSCSRLLLNHPLSSPSPDYVQVPSASSWDRKDINLGSQNWAQYSFCDLASTKWNASRHSASCALRYVA